MMKINYPHLPDGEAAALQQALALRSIGARVVVSLTYTKVTSTAPRMPAKDYIEIPGVAAHVILGPVAKVATGKNGPYILIDALTRSIDGDPTAPGWTSVLPDGITRAVVLRITMPGARRRTAPAKTQHLTDDEIAAISEELFPPEVKR